MKYIILHVYLFKTTTIVHSPQYIHNYISVTNGRYSIILKRCACHFLSLEWLAGTRFANVRTGSRKEEEDGRVHVKAVQVRRRRVRKVHRTKTEDENVRRKR